MNGDDQIAQEKARAHQRTDRERLKAAAKLLRQHLGVEAQYGVVLPAELDRETLTWLGEDVEQEKS